MNIDSAYPSQYLKASDLGGKTARVAIRTVLMEEVGRTKDRKPILYFVGKEKGLCLNRTNANTIAMVYGQNTDDWEGGEIELYTAMVDFQGRQVEAVRVRIPPRKTTPAQQPRQAKPASNGQTRGPTWADGEPTAPGYDTGKTRVTSGTPPNPPAPPAGEPFNDDVPFAPEWR